MGREIRIPKRPVQEAVEDEMTYRIVVGEKGNEQGHIEYLDDGTTEAEAKKALRKALRAYAGDGWGRVEYDYAGTGWRRLGESKYRVVEDDTTMPVSVDEVVAELKAIRDDLASIDPEPDVPAEDDFMDVRLQVLDDGSWMLHTGDASYDTDHHGSWGAGTMTALDTDEELLTLAQDLISQADDMKAQVESRLLKGRCGLKEGRKEQNPPKSWTPEFVIRKLQYWQKQNPTGYNQLLDAWRDVVPHTGEQDVLLGSSQFKPWLKAEYKEWVDYPKEWQNWAAFCTDLRGLMTSEGREAQGFRKGLLEAEHNVDWGSLDEFTQGYIEALMWVAQDEKGYAYDNLTFDMLEPETVKKMVADCESFQSQNADLLSTVYETGRGPNNAGQDFALTRNGHGAGFWDRGLGVVGDKLTDAAHAFGEYNLRADDPENGPWFGESKTRKTRKNSQSALKESDSSKAGWVGFFVKGMPHYAYRMDGTHLKLGFSAGDPRAVVYHVDQLRSSHPELHQALTAWLNGRGELEGMRFEESRHAASKQSLTEGYTPGPWTLIAGRTFETSDGVFSLSYRTNPETGERLFRSPEALDANARLIAAAPEMYELLQSAVSLWGFMKSDPSLPQDEREAAQRSYDKAKAVMQKAVVESRKRVVKESDGEEDEMKPDLGTYIIYSSHLSNDPNDDVDAAAARLANHLRQKFPGLEVVVKHGVEGVGSGYKGDDPDLESDIEYEVEKFDIWQESRTVRPVKQNTETKTVPVQESVQSTSFLYVYDGTGGPISAELTATNLDEAVEIAKGQCGEWYDAAENALGLDPHADVPAEVIEAFGYDADQGFTLALQERLYPKAVATEDRSTTQRPLIERKRKVDITGLQKRGKPVQTFQFKSFTVDKAKAEKEGQ